MTEPWDKKALIQYRLERASESLEDARLMLAIMSSAFWYPLIAESPQPDFTLFLCPHRGEAQSIRADVGADHSRHIDG